MLCCITMYPKTNCKLFLALTYILLEHTSNYSEFVGIQSSVFKYAISEAFAQKPLLIMYALTSACTAQRVTLAQLISLVDASTLHTIHVITSPKQTNYRHVFYLLITSCNPRLHPRGMASLGRILN